MKECDDCLCNHHICEAECCKEFRIRINPRLTFRKGMKIPIRNTSPDFELYVKLRGFTSDKNFVYVKLDDFEKKGNYLYIYSKCELLTDDLLCMGHHGEVPRPKMCDFPNKDDNGVGMGIYLTPRCVFRK